MENIQLQEQKESIKLMKMSKGYQWEIKTLDMDLDRLSKINKRLLEEYGMNGYTGALTE